MLFSRRLANRSVGKLESEVGLLEDSHSNYDAVIVGAGPNGLFAYRQLKLAFPHFRLLLVEKGEPNQSLKSMPDVRWHSSMMELKLPLTVNELIRDDYIPTSRELSHYFDFFCASLGPQLKTNSTVVEISRATDREGKQEVALHVISGEASYTIKARYVIVSTGVYDTPRKLKMKGSEFFKYDYQLGLNNQNLLLVGGGNSAADFIIHLLPSNNITWVIRGASWASVFGNLEPQFKSVIEEYDKNLELYTRTSLMKASEDGCVLLSNGSEIGPFDSMHALIGFTPVSELVKNSGMELEGECLSLTENFECSTENVFFFGSAMAKWNSKENKPEATYVHNGNPKKLERIVRTIASREIEVSQRSTGMFETVEPEFGAPRPYLSLNFLRTIMAFVRVLMRKVVS